MFNGLAENTGVWHRHRYRYNMDKQKQHGPDVLHMAAIVSALSAVDARRVRSASSRTRTACAIYSVSFGLSPPSGSHSRRVYGGNLAFEIRKIRT
jgi:hypothetical protein